MLRRVFGSQTWQMVEGGLDGAAWQQRVIANNIANVNTPNFKRSDVVFADELARRLNPGPASLVQAGAAPPKMTATPAGRLITDTRTSMRTDGNNIDIDREMANLTKNNLYYEAMARQASALLQRLRLAITEGRG